jgi:hypothetical protein
MLHYEHAETTTGYITPSDHMTAQTLDGTWLTIPNTQMETVYWVDHVRLMVRLILGDHCPANQHLDKLWDQLNRIHLVQNWREQEWRTCVWFLHSSLRDFMRTADPTRLRRLSDRVQDHDHLNFYDLPLEMRKTQTPPTIISGSAGSTMAGSSNASTMSSITTGTGWSGKRNATQDGGSRKKTEVIPPLASHLRPLLESYKDKISKTIRANLIFASTAHIDSIFGPEYIALLSPADKQICLRHHIFGRCGAHNCSRAHATTNKPSDAILAGIHSRLKARLDELATLHPN